MVLVVNQEQLANVSKKLSDRGTFVLLSNSDTLFIRKLYSDFNIKEASVQTVNVLFTLFSHVEFMLTFCHQLAIEIWGASSSEVSEILGNKKWKASLY
jgi:hypothetical protein